VSANPRQTGVLDRPNKFEIFLKSEASYAEIAVHPRFAGIAKNLYIAVLFLNDKKLLRTTTLPA
jgi:hypothetical protein